MMHNEGDSVHLSEEEASGGSKDGVVRWVLIFGTLLAIIALSAIWITGAASSDDPNADNANVSAKIAAEQSEAAKDRGEPIAPAAGPQTQQGEGEDGSLTVEN